jgi:hypothetical protein
MNLLNIFLQENYYILGNFTSEVDLSLINYGAHQEWRIGQQRNSSHFS